jgi:hypothetical protein
LRLEEAIMVIITITIIMVTSTTVIIVTIIITTHQIFITTKPFIHLPPFITSLRLSITSLRQCMA